MLPLIFSAWQNMKRDGFSELMNSGFAVDDNNEPVPQKISVAITVNAVANTTIDRNTIAAEDCVFDGVDKWITPGGGVFLPAKLKTTNSSSIPRMSILGFFPSLLPV